MNICRTCLESPADKRISELANGLHMDSKNDLDIMVFCLDITVAENSKVTTNLCETCFTTIISFYNFKSLSLKNDAYLKSLDIVEQSTDQKLSMYVDENGIKHENFLDSDELGPNVIEDCNTDIKTEEYVKDEILQDVEMDAEYEDILENVESDEEPLCVIQKCKNIVEQAKKSAPKRKKICPPEKERPPKKPEQANQMCKECGKTFINLKKHLLRHVPHMERQKIQCKACPKLFLNAGDMAKHYKITHLGLKKRCLICNKEVTRLAVHLARHNPATMRFSCVKCERRFVSQAVLNAHLKSHTNVNIVEQAKESAPKRKKTSPPKKGRPPKKPEQAKQVCEKCGKSFIDLKKHLLRHQPNTERQKIQCKACPKLFLNAGDMAKHYKVTHLGLKKQCPICNKEVTRLPVHLARHNPATMRFPCVKCKRSFVSQAVLEAHLDSHTNNYSYECHICNKKFRSKGFVTKHIRQVHEKERTHQCKICPKAFFSSNALREHIRTHSTERQFECDECGLTFKTKVTLRNHVGTHTDVKRFHCDQCSKSFKMPAYLNFHMVTHTKEKRYACRHCGVRFGRAHHRSRHEFTAHKNS